MEGILHGAAVGLEGVVAGELEGALQLAHLLPVGVGLGELVHLELHDLLLDLHRNGNDLVLKAAGVDGGAGLALGGVAEVVQLFPGDAPHVADVLSGGAHVIVVEGVPQAVLDHGVNQALGAHGNVHLLAVAQIGQGVGSSGHVLHAAGYHDVRVAAGDGTAGLDDGLHAGAADHADGVGGHGQGHAGLDGGLAGGVLAQAGGQDVAHHDLIHTLRGNAGAAQGLADDDGAQLHGRGALQRSAEGADGSAAAVYDVNILHFALLSLYFHF